uniref:Membrane protein insertase YidC n=1 Tax=Desulfobacca acetoxidans TaxID=60893 RepID=A0A7C3V6T0_9BACT
MQTRTILAVVLSLLVFIIFTYVGQHYGPKPAPESPAPPAAAPATGPSPPAAPPAPVAKPLAAPPAPKGREIVVETDLFRAVFTEQGAGLKSFQLKKFRQSLPIETISKFSLGPVSFELERFRDHGQAAAQLKELVTAAPNQELPLSLSWEGRKGTVAPDQPYEADTKALTLKGGETGSLTFKAVTPEGLEVTRTYTFKGQSYVFNLKTTVARRSPENLEGRLNLALTGTAAGSAHEAQGLAIFADKALKEFKAGGLKEPKVFTKVDWVGLNELYFLAAAVPQGAPQVQATLTEAQPNQLAAILSLPEKVAAGQEVQAMDAFYFGPKDISTLKAANLGLDTAVHFGWFDWLARPCLYFLNWINGFVHNYGWSLIILTFLLRLLFWYPNHKSFQSMKVMQKIQPRVAEIREKYKDDREAMNKELMNLYRTFKVNPLGGCLPMLLQLPVFLALYNLLSNSIELRHASFIPTLPFTNIVWLADLSAKDPLLITPIIMGATMFLQQKMSPSPGDPAQAKMMMFLPLIFTFLFLNFASGLVIYWLVNNVLAIAQQYFTNRYIK